MEFNTIAISDGITMGTSGHEDQPRVAARSIADRIELVARGHLFDGVIALSGCDKTIPGTVMALARLDVPGVMLYGGSIPPGRFHGRDVTIQDVFEAVGAHAAGQDHRRGARGARGRRQPRRRRLRRPVHGQHDGHGLRGAWASARSAPSSSPPRTRTKARGGLRRPGELVDRRPAPRPAPERHHHQRRRSRTPSPPWPPAAARPTRVLHLLAVAREAGVDARTSTTSTASPRARPRCATSSPGGRYVAVDLYAAGGIRSCCPAPARGRPAPRGRAHRHRPDDRRARRARPRRPRGSRSSAPLDDPLKRHRRPRHPARQPRPRGLRGQARRPRRRRHHRGPARVFDGEEDAMAAVTGQADQRRRRRRHPQRGPRRRPRHARDARGDRARSWARASARRWRCSPTAASPAPRTASWPATSRPRRRAAAPSPPSARATRSPSTSTHRRLDVDLSDDEIAAPRGRVHGRRPPAYDHGVLAKYATLVSSASVGAVTQAEPARAPATAPR